MARAERQRMKTHPALPQFRAINPTRLFRYFVTASALMVSPLAAADAPVPAEFHAQLSSLSGMYKVMSATDPLFPGDESQEWFLDFGKGVTTGKTSGTVAVSLRQNPNVRIRIMVWQLSPQDGVLRIGNQTAEGSRQAVLRAEWQMSRTSSGLVLRRNGYQAVLRPSGPND
jgi:hypothetical protein